MTGGLSKWRLGVQGQIMLMIVLASCAMLASVLLLLQRQAAIRAQSEQIGRRSMERIAERELESRARGRVADLARTLGSALQAGDVAAIATTADAVRRETDVAYVRVYDADGRVVNTPPEPAAGRGRSMPDALPAPAGQVVVQRTPDVLEIAAPISRDGQRVGGVRIGYALSGLRETARSGAAELDQRMQELARQQQLPIWLLLASVPLLSVFMAWWVQRRIIRPILRLAEHAQAIESGRYDVELADSGRRDEVGDLERAFIRMGRSVSDHDNHIRSIAYTDALTGLPNRRALRERLDACLAEDGAENGLALLFIDIDDFKRTNDTLGHEAGDLVLIRIADRIRQVLDTMSVRDAEVARFGGDEFVILIRAREDGARALSAVASQVAESVVDLAARPVELADGQHVYLGASIGVTLYPGDAPDAGTLLKNGDIAMYQAKNAGKHCYRFYHPVMEQVVERRMRMEQELRTAWEHGELTLVYQPVFRLSDRRIMGAEALLRWNHPQYGLVAPSVFISVAEDSGLIEEIGPQVMRAACMEAVHWPTGDAGEPAPFVSVNFSARQFRDHWLPSQVEQILAESGMPPERLHVELTETAVLDPAVAESGVIPRLRELGVRVWLDDFGTGFSGLNHLRTLTVDGVKIDRTFVNDILRDADDLVLTRAVIGMAHSLGMVVVAEGIEEAGQFELLREAGCELGQGYWLGQPIGHDELLQLLHG